MTGWPNRSASLPAMEARDKIGAAARRDADQKAYRLDGIGAGLRSSRAAHRE